MGTAIKLLLTKLQELPLSLRAQFFSAHVWQGILMAGDVRFLDVRFLSHKTMMFCPVDERYYHPDNLNHTLIWTLNPQPLIRHAMRTISKHKPEPENLFFLLISLKLLVLWF